MDDADDLPERRLAAWHRAFDDREVERVVIRAGTVRLCLRSGVELEWQIDDAEGPGPGHLIL